MNYFFFQMTRAIGVFFRTLRAFFARKIMGLGAQLRRLTNFSRHATKAASSSLQGVMSAAQKPTQPSDYVETGRLYISKALIIRILVGIVALFLLIYFVIWPFILSRFLTARFYEEDKRVKDWSGRVIVYSDKKKRLPLYSGRLEDGVLQGACKQYDRTGVLLFEGQLQDGMRVGAGKEYEEGVLVYEGQFASDLYSGRGRRFEDGQLVYDGQYDAGMRSGSGTAYEDGTLLYKGQFLDDLYEGRGKLYKNGDLYYDGGFHAGQAEGTGTVYEGGRLLYEGQFLGGLYEGRGKLYENGVLRYDGSFHVGVPDGTGTAYYPSGRISYQGQYLSGKPDGIGSEYREDGRKAYDGGFADGVYSGMGTMFFADGSQLEATFQNGEAEGSVEWKKNGLPYYQGEWTDGGPSGFGVLYSKAGKKIYEGPFLGGTIDGRSLLGYSADELREAFCESTLKSERVDDGYRILAEELGVTALCTFQTEGEPSTVYQIYLAAPAKSDWVTILPGMEHTRGVQWPPDVTPIQRTIRYIGQYGVNVEAGTYYAENALEEDWRTTALYADETRQQVVLLTWVRSDVTPIPLDIGGGSAGEDSVEAFLDALDKMDATAGSDLGEGAVFGSADPDSLLSGMADASEAVSLADAMIRRWELTEELSALTEAFDRTGILLEDLQDQISKGLASAEAVTELEQEQLELTSRIEACRTELKRAELQTDAAGIEDLGDYALGDMLVEFDPAEQDFSTLSLVAVAYAQATGSSRDAGEVQNEVKESLLDLTDAYGEVKLALAHYQNLVSNTKNEASAYAMGLGSKEAWYGAMNRQTLGRIELCGALAAFSRLANSFNQLTGGWVSRTFDWHRDSFETLFLADVLPVEVFAEAAAEAAGKAAEEAEKAAAAAEEAQQAAREAEGNAMAEYAAKQPAEEAKQAAQEAAAAASLAQSAAETAADASMRASLAANSAEAAVQASRAESAAEEASSASEQAREAQAAAEEAAKKAAEIAAMAAAKRAAAAQEGGLPPHG